MPVGDPPNLQLGAENVIRHEAVRPRDGSRFQLPRWRLGGSPTGIGSCYNISFYFVYNFTSTPHTAALVEM